MDEIFSNPVTLGAIGLVVLVVVAVIAFQAGKRSVTRSEADGGSGTVLSVVVKRTSTLFGTKLLRDPSPMLLNFRHGRV